MSKRKKDTLGRVMSKVRKGEKLSKRDKQIIGAAIDGAKKSKTERKEKKYRRKTSKKRKPRRRRRRDGSCNK